MRTPLQDRAFLLILAIVTLAFFWVILPFYGAVFWAVILAIVFRPLQRRLEILLHGRRNLAALISVAVCVLIAVLPITLIVSALVTEGAQFVERMQSAEGGVPQSVAEVYDILPFWITDALARFGIDSIESLRERLTALALAVGELIAGQALSVGQNTLKFLAGLGVMIYVLFFLFRDGPFIGRAIRESLPLSPELSSRALKLFSTVVKATVKGNLVIAMIQGTIGGFAFWLLGIPAPLLWGVLMTFLSILPAVGAGLVWAPAAAYLVLTGDYARGAILVVIGVGVISLVDNLLRPRLVGKDTRLPDYLVLVSTLGGLSIFGINGFVIGPLIAAMFLAGWTIFREEWSGRKDEPLA
jgi:predicted PurR-regulated permease PerM